MSRIKEITERELASLGSKPYQVLVENRILKYNKQNVFVKIVVIKDKPSVEFGYFNKNGSDLTFIPTDEISDIIDERMKNKILAGIDFSSVASMFEDIVVESNSTLRIINYSRSLFVNLSKSIYFNETKGALKAGSMELSLIDVNKIYDYLEKVYVSGYMDLLSGKIISYLKRQSNDVLKAYMSFKNFIPILYKGKCVVNPLLDSCKIGKNFRGTSLYKKAISSSFTISEGEVVYLLTNKEICECLSLEKYLRFYPSQFTFFLLGLFNSKDYPSSENLLFIDENGRLANPNSGGELRQISSLQLMCLNYVSYLCPPSMIDEYVDILSTARLS